MATVLLDMAPTIIGIFAAFVAALFTNAEPTGTPLWDLLVVGAFVFIVTIAASRATRWPVLFLLIVPLVGVGIGAMWVIVAAGVGAAIVQEWRNQPMPLVRTIAAALGAIGAVAILQLHDRFGISRLSAVMAAAAVIPVLVSAFKATDSPVRFRVRQAALGIGAFCVLAGVLALGSSLAGRSAAEAGIQRAEDGLDFARQGNQEKAIEQLALAEEHFADAEGRFGAVWAKPARFVPILAQNHRAVEVAAVEGRALTRAAQSAAGSADIDQVRGANGQIDIALLATVGSELSNAESTLLEAQRSLTAARSPWLLSPLGKRVDAALELLGNAGGDISLAAEAARVVPGMLGADGERTYLVMFTNPAEPREFGGFASAFAFISANNGKVSVIDAGYGGDLDEHPDIPRPGLAEADTYPEPYLNYGANGLANYFGNLTATIDLPTIARATRDVMPKKGLPEIDGLLVMDPFALAAMMELVDLEVAVEGTDTTLNKDTLPDYLMKGQYESITGTGIGVFSSIDARTEALVATGERIFASMLSAEIPGPERLGEVFGPVARQKRLQFTTFDDEENAFLNRIFLRSQIPATQPTVDYIHVTTDAAAPNKLEPYLERDILYDVEFDPSTGRFFGNLAVSLTNRAPEDLPAYVQGSPGWYFELEPGTHRSRVSLWSNHNVRDVFENGLIKIGQETYFEYGRLRRLVFTDIPRGVERVITTTVDGSTRPGWYNIYVGAQPAATETSMTINVTAPAGWVESTTGESTFSAELNLVEDVLLAVHFIPESENP